MIYRWIFRIAVCCCLSNAASGQTALDSAYRKLDGLITLLRARNADLYTITSPSGVDEASFVSVGGIDQWVTIKGQDRANPAILFLHGGPGDVTNPWTYAIFAPWEKYFTIVQWDERGAGRTFAKNGPGIGPTMTVDQLVHDGIELAEYVRRHLGKSKIILVGHSFGSVLGVTMAHRRPDLFYAYVGTGQVADETRNYAVTYEALVAKARSSGNERALADLRRVGPPPYSSGDGYRAQWKWANAFEGADQFIQSTLAWRLVAPGASVLDLNASEEGEAFSGEHLVPELHGHRPADFGFDFSIPVFVFQGAEDFTASTELARQYVDSIRAPVKAFVPIVGGGHFAVFMRSDAFLKELVDRVRPLALPKRKASGM